MSWVTIHHLLYVVGAVVYVVVQTLLARKSQIDAWCEANPKKAGLVKLWRAVSPDLLLFKQGLALIFKGKLPDSYKELEVVTQLGIEEAKAK